MTLWKAFLRGEDNTEFTVQLEAETMDLAEAEIEDRYPEATVLEIFDPAVRAQDVYERASRMYDDPTLDDYSDYN